MVKLRVYEALRELVEVGQPSDYPQSGAYFELSIFEEIALDTGYPDDPSDSIRINTYVTTNADHLKAAVEALFAEEPDRTDVAARKVEKSIALKTRVVMDW